MDYYTILGLRSDASEEEIKKSFRRLALKFHPDRHANSSHESQEQFSVRFKQISEAYEVLSDHKRRALYNREGRAGLRSNQHQGYGAAGGGYRSAYAYGKYYKHGGGSSGGSAGFYEGRGRWPSPLKSFTRMDFVFHAILAGVTIMGFIFVDSFGDAIWKRRNSGKSFEDMIEAADQSKHEKAFATSEGGPPQV